MTLALAAPPRPNRRKTLAERLAMALSALGGHEGVILSHAESAWASITFAGTRHKVVMRFEGIEAVEAGEQLVELLPEHEFTIPGQLVADACVTKVEHLFGPVETLTVTAELLLLEEG